MSNANKFVSVCDVLHAIETVCLRKEVAEEIENVIDGLPSISRTDTIPDPHAIARRALEAAALAAERYASFPQPTSRAARYHETHSAKPNIAAAIRALLTNPAEMAKIVEGKG
jgi:hypothetical protein